MTTCCIKTDPKIEDDYGWCTTHNRAASECETVTVPRPFTIPKPQPSKRPIRQGAL